jgi:hypothetical protein
VKDALGGRPHFRRLVAAVSVVLAAGIVVLTLIPASVWRHPTTDALYRGFDRHLIYVSPTGPAEQSGDIKVSASSLTIAAKPGSHPTVHLVTTPLSYSASFDAKVVAESPGSTPLRIELWSPATAAGYVLLFDGDLDQSIREQVIEGAGRAMDMIGGTVRTDRFVGRYVVGETYHVALKVDQSKRQVSVQIAGAGIQDAGSVLTPADAPGLFSAFRPTLTMSADATFGSSEASISNYSVTLPSQTSNTAEATVKVDDPVARALARGLWVAAIVLSLVLAGTLLAPRLRRTQPRLVVGAIRSRTRAGLVIGLLAAIYLIANLPLFGVGSLHFDILAAKVWSYVASSYGFTDLYYRTLLVPAAAPWLGVPVHEATFPYGFTKAYYYLGAGWIHQSLFGAQNIQTAFTFEQLLKGFNVLFGFADSLLVYLIMKPLIGGLSARWSAILLGLNPALFLVMSVWGSTESISLFFILGSIWLAEERRPLGAWLMLAAAAYTRPQMLVIAFLLGLVYLRKFGFARNRVAIPWAVIVAFIFIGPFAIAISPSLPVDYVVRTFAYHIGNGQADVAYLGISPGNFSAWPIPLLLISGDHGLERMWAPSTQVLSGPVTYGQLGAALSITFLLAVGAILLVSSRASTQPGQYIPLVGFGLLGWLLVTPGVISRYLLYAVVLVILSRQVFTLTGYLSVVGVLTATTLAGIYGQLALDFLGYSGSLNVLSPTNNAISGFLFGLFATDWFITLASLSNVVVLITLGARAWQSLRSERVPELATASSSF